MANGKCYLIDASPDIREQVIKFGIERIDGLLITHSHADHILGLDHLRLFNHLQQNSIPLYATPKHLRVIKEVFKYMFKNNVNIPFGWITDLTIHEIDALTPFYMDDLYIQPFPLLHGRDYSTGYKIGNIAYATDCHEIPDASKNIIKNSQNLFIDGLRHRPHNAHFSVAEVIQVTRELNVQQTYIIHMSHELEYNELATNLPDDMKPAYDGLVVSGQT
jgi:phosphoribosyl 1,2-cyclic phosphate phosphodiesterase